MKPIAVFMTVRNRFAVTKKCIEALYKNTHREIHLFVFDNCTTTRIDEHFDYFCSLYKENKLQKYVINTIVSTCNAFSKATSFNEFGLFLETHPNKEMYEWFVCLDNDMVMIMKDWDDVICDYFKFIDSEIPNNTIEILGQLPGGVSGVESMLNGNKVRIGVNGGSGFWNLRTDFFTKVGLLELEPLVGISKRHDQNFWSKLRELHKGKPYICAIDLPMALHVAYYDGQDLSICKKARNNPSMEVDFPDFDKLIDSMTYDEFLDFIKKDEEVFRRW